jgi:hypothetical protein
VSEYRYLSINPLTLQLQGEIEFGGVQFNWQQNNFGTFDGTIDRYDTKATKALLDPQRTLIGVEREGDLVWVGIMLQPRKADADTVSIPALEIHGMLQYRYIRERLQYAALDSGFVCRQLVAYGQLGVGGPLGIATGSQVTGVPISTSFNFWDKKKISDAIIDLSTPTSAAPSDGVNPPQSANPGFDFRMDYAWGAGNQLVMTFVIDYPKRGRATNYVFEYGRNVDDYDWEGGLAYNWIDSWGDGSENALRRATAYDSDLLANYPRFEGQYEHPTVTGQQGLQNFADAELKQHKSPQSEPSITLMGDADPGLGEYRVCDIVEVRIDHGYTQVGDNYIVDDIAVSVDETSQDTVQVSFEFDDSFELTA